MKTKRNKNSIFSALLCLLMAALLAFGLAACDKGDDEGPKEGEVAVVRFVAAMKKGEQITEDKVAIDYVAEAAIPLNALRELEAVVGKYLVADVVAGDYVFNAKLSESVSQNKADAPDSKAYIAVKPNVTAGADNTADIQKLINENPCRTLYFADGTYTISSPLTISADPQKKVSFELADFAVIKAADSWSGEDAMIRIGATDADLNFEEVGSTSALIKGGCIDGNGKAVGVAVEGGRDSELLSLTVKNTTVGIVLGGKDTRTVLEHVDVVGNGKDSSTGISVTSDENAFDYVQIDKSGCGIKISGNRNLFKNVHATYYGTDAGSRGFDESGSYNSFDTCFAENYATGFYMGSKNAGSVYSSCLVFWSGDIATQTGFAAEGKFNSAIRTCKVYFESDSATSAYLTVGAEGGEGEVHWPIVRNLAKMDIKTYESYLAGTKLTEELN